MEVGFKRLKKAVTKAVTKVPGIKQAAKTITQIKKSGVARVGARIGKGILTGGLSEAVKHKTGRRLVGQAAVGAGTILGGVFGGPLGAGAGGAAGQLFADKYLKDRSWKQAAGSALKTGALAGGGWALAGAAPAMLSGTAQAAGGAASSLGGMLPTTAGGWLSAGGKALSLGKGALGMLGGGGGAGGGGGLAGLYGAYQGYKGQEGALSDLAGLESRYGGLLGRQEELAGLDPAVAAQMQRRAQQSLRGAQAERGIYESGVAAAQEAELMPQIEQSQKAWQLQQLAGITPQYGLPMESAFRRAGMYGTGQEAGAALAGGEG